LTKIAVDGKDIEIDEEGFLKNFDDWNEVVAENLAQIDNVYPLNEDALKVINYLREYYSEHGIAPPVRMLVKRTGLELTYIYQLFPNGPAKSACKVAGLPKPTGCV